MIFYAWVMHMRFSPIRSCKLLLSNQSLGHWTGHFGAWNPWAWLVFPWHKSQSYHTMYFFYCGQKLEPLREPITFVVLSLSKPCAHQTEFMNKTATKGFALPLWCLAHSICQHEYSVVSIVGSPFTDHSLLNNINYELHAAITGPLFSSHLMVTHTPWTAPPPSPSVPSPPWQAFLLLHCGSSEERMFWLDTVKIMITRKLWTVQAVSNGTGPLWPPH